MQKTTSVSKGMRQLVIGHLKWYPVKTLNSMEKGLLIQMIQELRNSISSYANLLELNVVQENETIVERKYLRKVEHRKAVLDRTIDLLMERGVVSGTVLNDIYVDAEAEVEIAERD